MEKFKPKYTKLSSVDGGSGKQEGNLTLVCIFLRDITASGKKLLSVRPCAAVL
jgi:hypothetical protein